MTKTRNIFILIGVVLILLGLIGVFSKKEIPEPILDEPEMPVLTTKYITAMEWPPSVETRSGTLTCTTPRTINDRTYCVSETTEGAAGSVYTTYKYETQQGENIVSTTFTLRMVQCLNYDDPERTECENERAAFNVDLLADKLLQATTI